MKAITIREPWASMILTGKKSIEVRTWRTHHRGEILLCASKATGGKFAGQAFAVATIDDVRPMKRGDRKAAGNYFDPNAFAWVLSGVKRIKPFAVRGWPGIFEVAFKRPAARRARMSIS